MWLPGAGDGPARLSVFSTNFTRWKWVGSDLRIFRVSSGVETLLVYFFFVFVLRNVNERQNFGGLFF